MEQLEGEELVIDRSLERHRLPYNASEVEAATTSRGIGGGAHTSYTSWGQETRTTMAETADMERIFKRFDTNGDGKISLSELTEALRTLGSTSADEVQRMMAEIDTDGDGCIDFNEFITFCNANPGLMKDVAKVF